MDNVQEFGIAARGVRLAAMIQTVDEEVSEEPNAQGIPQVFEWGAAQVPPPRVLHVLVHALTFSR